MSRVAGVEIPGEKHVWVGLTRIFGVGRSLSVRILKEAGIQPNVKVKSLTEDQISRINTIVDKNFPVEGVLRRQVGQNIERLKHVGCHRGFRHRRGLPVRGQRTRTNARTRKGPRKTVAGKKQVKTIG